MKVMEVQNLLKRLHLSLLNINECCVENWNFRNVISPFTRLYLVEDGQGNVIHNHERYELRRGWLYLIPSFTSCSYASKSFLRHFYIHFIPQLACGTDIFKLLGFKYEVEANETDFYLMSRILAINPGKKLIHTNPGKYGKAELVPSHVPVVSSRQIADSIETQGIMLQLFSRFIKTEAQANDSAGYSSNSAISRAVNYIQMNLPKPFTIAELAGICNLSGDYFSRLFFKTTGLRPVEYINSKRIEQAQLQLATTNDPVEKIALDVGIDNFSYFNRMFKKYSCTTPGAYRKLHRLV